MYPRTKPGGRILCCSKNEWLPHIWLLDLVHLRIFTVPFRDNVHTLLRRHFRYADNTLFLCNNVTSTGKVISSLAAQCSKHSPLQRSRIPNTYEYVTYFHHVYVRLQQIIYLRRRGWQNSYSNYLHNVIN